VVEKAVFSLQALQNNSGICCTALPRPQGWCVHELCVCVWMRKVDRAADQGEAQWAPTPLTAPTAQTQQTEALSAKVRACHNLLSQSVVTICGFVSWGLVVSMWCAAARGHQIMI